MKPSQLTIRQEANALTCLAFRNGFLEDLHSTKISELVKRKQRSRITDAEMKRLMIESSAVVAWYLELKEKNPEEYWRRIKWAHESYTKGWDTKDGFKLKKREASPPWNNQ